MLFRSVMGTGLTPRICKVLLQLMSNQKNSFKTQAKGLKRQFLLNELQIATKHIIQRGIALLAIHHALRTRTTVRHDFPSTRMVINQERSVDESGEKWAPVCCRWNVIQRGGSMHTRAAHSDIKNRVTTS